MSLLLDSRTAPLSSPPFLGVSRSITGRSWRTRGFPARDAQAIAEKNDLPELLGRVLAARGVGLEAVEDYLNPTLRRFMPQPSALLDMEKGADRLARAIIEGERIGTISDYDVDGVSSAALVTRFLASVGAANIVHIPDRLTEGYGPSRAAVQSLKERGTQLLLTLDCGVLAHDPLAEARALGMDVVIVDHHQAGIDLPEATAVINPNRQDDISGFGYLCACGVAMILVSVVNRLLRQHGWYTADRPEPNMLQWLELVALATVCDVVPLTGLNRAYVTQGLRIMARRENPGLAALADAARLKRRPDAYALAFLLGPRLNAAGRIGHANLAFELLVSQERGRCAIIAAELERLNRERQAIELAVLDQALREAEAGLGAERTSPAIVVAGEGWHPGVLGLAASRLKERFNLPSIVLGFEKDGLKASGSGRSISGVDLGQAVRTALAAGILIKGGGHAMAAGLTIERSRLGDFRAFLETELAYSLKLSGERYLDIDGALTASGATLDLIELVEQAGPYGAGNPAPVFVLPAHRVVYADSAGSDHVRLTLASADGTRIKAIAFRALGTDLGELLLTERQHPLHVAGRLVVDDWGRERVPSLHVEDVAHVG
ncbi:single-stranded-DNA-specific exonuclease RecJ [Taklimakanibacter lacteus]|uniref:single-stranded-DNA-specific exonuclease RecJ n=1 Tax=Taklimakanibacter lacteus TaxID=2268456 RepID=UPI000E674258